MLVLVAAAMGALVLLFAAADGRLTTLARDHSCDMARRGFFDHASPEGRTLGDRVRTAGIRFRAIGENIARIESADPVKAAVSRWMKSPPHRDNIFTREFTHTGVGACRGGRAVYFTQVFLRAR